MCHQARSELLIITNGQSINVAYYRTEVLEKTCMAAVNRVPNNGSILERPMLENISNFIFMQDGALAHTANVTQLWCKAHLKGFWAKAEWPGNSPDLNKSLGNIKREGQ